MNIRIFIIHIKSIIKIRLKIMGIKKKIFIAILQKTQLLFFFWKKIKPQQNTKVNDFTLLTTLRTNRGNILAR